MPCIDAHARRELPQLTGLCCCVCVMSFEHQLTLLCVDSRVGCILQNVAAFKSRI